MYHIPLVKQCALLALCIKYYITKAFCVMPLSFACRCRYSTLLNVPNLLVVGVAKASKIVGQKISWMNEYRECYFAVKFTLVSS